MPDKPPVLPDKPLVPKPNVKTEDYFETYANNVQFDLTSWDIELLFGNIVKTETESQIEISVEQHTAVRLSWPQAKIAALIFAVNVAAQEEKNGPIKIPTGVIPNVVDDKDVGLSMEDIFKQLVQRVDEAKTQAQDKPKE